jgi:hypothetical protein
LQIEPAGPLSPFKKGTEKPGRGAGMRVIRAFCCVILRSHTNGFQNLRDGNGINWKFQRKTNHTIKEKRRWTTAFSIFLVWHLLSIEK